MSFGGLFRGDERADSQDPTCAVILQHDLARLTLPGQSQQLHLYDSSNLSALRSAFSRKTFVHVALDPEATAKRMFGVIGVGTECRILSSAPSSKQNKWQESSSSLVVDVIGVRQRQVLECTQREPHVRALLRPLEGGGSLVTLPEAELGELDALRRECHEMRGALKLPSELVDIEAMRREMFTDAPAPGGDELAWACARTLCGMRSSPPGRRLRALQICEPAALLQFVLAELREERQRLVAMRSLQNLS